MRGGEANAARPSRQCRENDSVRATEGASIYDVRKISDFLTPSPLVSRLTQPPLLRLLTISAFEGIPLPPQCGRHKWKPPKAGRKDGSIIPKPE